MPITEAARIVNFRQRERIVEKLQSTLSTLEGKIIGILGLAFKPNTDDIREAPALDIIRELIAAGATVRAHDPIAIPNAQAALHGKDETTNPELHFTENVYELSYDADALVLITEWDFYHKLELRRLAKQMKTPILIDGRNVYSPEEARTAGFHYIGVGRV
jgi:UDPglucose 6-dehydrogenase